MKNMRLSVKWFATILSILVPRPKSSFARRLTTRKFWQITTTTWACLSLDAPRPTVSPKSTINAEAFKRPQSVQCHVSPSLRYIGVDRGRGGCPYPFHVVTLSATNIALSSAVSSLLPHVEQPTVVKDYRYKRSNATHIFKYADYSLQPGDSWKTADDPKLLAEAADYLVHGRKYEDWANSRKMWTIWILLMAILAPLVIISYKNILKTKASKQT